MANNPQPKGPDQSFAETERLFHRVRQNNIGRHGKATFLAFALPDMSVNRERDSTAENARSGFEKPDWGVAAFVVKDIPPDGGWAHGLQTYLLRPRHVPEPGNFPHSEVRVWRAVQTVSTLITTRDEKDFGERDPDREEPRGTPEALLDPDFHMRWRKHIALASKMVLPPCGGQHP